MNINRSLAIFNLLDKPADYIIEHGMSIFMMPYLRTMTKKEMECIFLLFKELWDLNRKRRDKHIEVVSRPFSKAVGASIDRLIDVANELEYRNDRDRYGVLILPKGRSFIYNFPKDKNNEPEFVIVVDNVGHIIDFNVDFMEKHWPEEKTFLSSGLITVLKVFIAFKTYGKVEYLELENGRKIKNPDVENGKVLNQSGYKVEILDSKWFTTIFRKEGFSVSGHFRLQPKKNAEGEWYRELIYIEPFEKHGYTRISKIEKAAE